MKQTESHVNTGGTGFVPLRNVMACAKVMEHLVNRAPNLPGMGVFAGPSGYGKSCAASYCANKFNAYYIECRSYFTKKSLLLSILDEMGAMTDTATRLLLTKLGLNPEKDVILLQVGGTATRMAALIGGSVDATLVAPPDYKKAVEAGMRVLVNMEEIGIPYQHQSLVTTQSFIAKNPSIVQRMVKSFVEGIHLMRTNPELSKRTISKYMRVKEEKDLEEAYQLLRRLIPAKPYPSLEGFKTVLAGLAKEIPAAATANPRDFVDVRFLEELDRSGFIDGLYR